MPHSLLRNRWRENQEGRHRNSVAIVSGLGYDAAMGGSLHLQAWRMAKGQTLESLAVKSRLELSYLAEVEAGERDCKVSSVQIIAASLGISPSWLYGHPDDLYRILQLEDTEANEPSASGVITDAIDPVLERILRSVGRDRTLYALVTALLHSGDERLTRAAEVSLRSLVKEANRSSQAVVPWVTRPSGHFEPPSD